MKMPIMRTALPLVLSSVRMCAVDRGTPLVDVTHASTSIVDLLGPDEKRVVRSLGYEVCGSAGSGHYGCVLLAQQASGAGAAIKLAPHPSETLVVEATILGAMQGVPGFPEFFSFEQAADGTGLDAIAMELLGPSLHDVWEKETASTYLPGPTVLRLGRGILRCLRALHAAGYIHNDVKPNNVLLGAAGSGKEGEVHLIDLGLATRVDGPSLGGGRGTPLFASVAAHTGAPMRPVHDVEAMIYCLAYLASGSLPWERKPPRRGESMKRRMLTDGCTISTLLESCAADRLTEDVHAAETVEALQAVWAEVVAGHDTSSGSVDYDACDAALRSGE